MAACVVVVLVALIVLFAPKIHTDVWLVNGLDGSVAVTFDGETHQVDPNTGVAVTARSGRYQVRVTDPSGNELATEFVVVDAENDFHAYNVLGAAPITRLRTDYSDSAAAHSMAQLNALLRSGRGNGPPPELRLFAGETWVTLYGVDHVFEKAPEEIRTRDHRASRWSVDVIPGGWRAALAQLLLFGQVTRARNLARVLDESGLTGLEAERFVDLYVEARRTGEMPEGEQLEYMDRYDAGLERVPRFRQIRME